MTPLLDVNGLWAALARGRRRTILLRAVELRVMPGEVHGLVGESGAGKSMIARAVLGILPPDIEIIRGGIALDGEDLIGMAPRARRALLGAGLAMIPQDPMTALNPVRRIGAQMVDGIALHLKLDRKAALARSEELLASVHLREPKRILQQYPFELSGGMRQRVSFLRTLLAGKPVLALDEPFAALDAITRHEMQGWLSHVLTGEPRTVVLITHDVEEAVILGDRVVVMSPRPGRTVAEIDVRLARPRRRTDPTVVEMREQALAALGVRT